MSAWRIVKNTRTGRYWLWDKASNTYLRDRAGRMKSYATLELAEAVATATPAPVVGEREETP